MFTLAISCLITSNLPWFMDLTFHVPMEYFSLQHGTLLSSPDACTSGRCFCFGFISLFFPELFLHWSPVAYWAPNDLGSSSFGILSFCLFILFMGFSRQEYWSGLPFPFPVDHILSDLSTMTRLSWVAPPAWLGFIELDKAVVLMWLDWLVFCDCGFQSVCPLIEKDKRLMEVSWWERLTEGKLGLVLMTRPMLSKSLIHFSIDGWGCVPSLLFDLRPNYGGSNEDNGTSFKRSHARPATLSAPTLQRPPLRHTSSGDSSTLTGKSGSVSCEVTAPLLLKFKTCFSFSDFHNVLKMLHFQNIVYL